MYRKPRFQETSLEINESDSGEKIETVVERLINNKEELSVGETKPEIYTPRDLGVVRDYDIRADKWDAAIAGADMVTGKMREKNEKRRQEREDKLKEMNKNLNGTEGSASSTTPQNATE